MLQFSNILDQSQSMNQPFCKIEMQHFNICKVENIWMFSLKV